MIYSEKLVEGAVADLPAVAGLSPAAAAVSSRMIWSRIEGYTGQRFGVRDAEWFVTGSRWWSPTVEPWNIEAVAAWDAGRELWTPAETTFVAGQGYSLSTYGAPLQYRFVGTVGSEGLPGEPFLTAYRRFAEYLAGQTGEVAALWAPGVSSVSVSDDGVGMTIRRDPRWMGAAWQASGAADALRYHRRPR